MTNQMKTALMALALIACCGCNKPEHSSYSRHFLRIAAEDNVPRYQYSIERHGPIPLKSCTTLVVKPGPKGVNVSFWDGSTWPSVRVYPRHVAGSDSTIYISGGQDKTLMLDNPRVTHIYVSGLAIVQLN